MSIDAMEPPVDLTFWRMSNETITRHRNPLFSAMIGTSVHKTLGIDWLHALSLGVINFIVMFIFHEALHRNIFKIANAPTAVIFELGVRRLLVELNSWYDDEQTAGRAHNKLTTLVPGMLGSYGDQCLKVHGAECNGLLSFCIHLLRKYRDAFGPEHRDILRAAETVSLAADLIRKHRHTFDLVAEDRLRKQMKKTIARVWAI